MQVQLWWQSHTSSSLPLSSILYREEAIAAGATWHIHNNNALSAAALSLRFSRNPNLTSRRFRLVTFTSNATFDDGDTRNDNVNDTGDRGDDDDDDDDGVEIEIEIIGKRRRRIRSKIAVNASLQNVWEVLTDYERLADFIPGLAVSQLLQKEPNFARLLQIGEQDLAFGLKFNAKGIVDCYEKDLEDLPIGQRRDIEFKMVEGDFKLFEGKWSIEQMCNPGSVKEHDSSAGQPFHTTLFYIVDVEPKLWLPVRVIEGRLCKEIKTNLRSVREEAQKVYLTSLSSY
ncbi:uncharacterized protein LOC107810622 [Nicotiana tabacum]|uniref:Uncharacterized protein LOC107810622 n=2 Tax=Nicotiana TaxID=4085 RepID=A0A1S4BPW4_TOBAC|nr:PREDICTED: uncharacterized protein LOC104212208 isoform X1 [Nicotiana sylvestris]XP_016490906.1 PREDICTED: uncharacterized protein LOC107810622 [Nicotiana tabacum]